MTSFPPIFIFIYKIKRSRKRKLLPCSVLLPSSVFHSPLLHRDALFFTLCLLPSRCTTRISLGSRWLHAPPQIHGPVALFRRAPTASDSSLSDRIWLYDSHVSREKESIHAQVNHRGEPKIIVIGSHLIPSFVVGSLLHRIKPTLFLFYFPNLSPYNLSFKSASASELLNRTNRSHNFHVRILSFNFIFFIFKFVIVFLSDSISLHLAAKKVVAKNLRFMNIQNEFFIVYTVRLYTVLM